MAPQKIPCPCPKCKGALMSKRTIKRHREHIILPSANITSYENWMKLDAGGSTGGTLAGGGTDDMSSSDDDDDEEMYGRPPKRCRTGREVQPELNNELEHIPNIENRAEGNSDASNPTARMVPEEHPEEGINDPENQGGTRIEMPDQYLVAQSNVISLAVKLNGVGAPELGLHCLRGVF
ncbi:hypothetical protein BYT27DRAFT_7244543 [Phlegmacium glaucopus]|nr:hypothetical protein BYT27DRAFT_7244543 [Phlegmacium glaucopus]